MCRWDTPNWTKMCFVFWSIAQKDSGGYEIWKISLNRLDGPIRTNSSSCFILTLNSHKATLYEALVQRQLYDVVFLIWTNKKINILSVCFMGALWTEQAPLFALFIIPLFCNWKFYKTITTTCKFVCLVIIALCSRCV